MTIKILKRVIYYLSILFVWYIFVNSSEKSEWYIELYTKDNVTVKVPRNEYLEFKELWNVDNYSENQTKNYYNIALNESIYWTDSASSGKKKHRYDKNKIKSFTSLFAIRFRSYENKQPDR